MRSGDAPDKVSGAGCSEELAYQISLSTRILEGGATVDEFLEGFPAVSREMFMPNLRLTDPLRPCFSSIARAYARSRLEVCGWLSRYSFVFV
jgi:hypothetical protein